MRKRDMLLYGGGVSRRKRDMVGAVEQLIEESARKGEIDRMVRICDRLIEIIDNYLKDEVPR